MSTSPIGGSASSPLATTEEPLDVGALSTSTSTGLASTSYLDVGFLQVTGSRLGIATPTAGGDTSILVAEVLAENEKLRLDSAAARTTSLSGRIQAAIATNAASTVQLTKLEAEVAAIETDRDNLETQRLEVQKNLETRQGNLNTLNTQISARQSVIDAQDALIAQIDAALAALDAEGTETTAAQALQDRIDALGARLVQLEAELDALEEAATPDAEQSLQAIADAAGTSLAQLQADLAALGAGGDPAARARLQAQIDLFAALGPALQAVLAGLQPDEQAGAAQTLEGFSAALATVIAGLESDLEERTSSGTEDTAGIAALQAQISALGMLAARIETQVAALTGTGEEDEAVPADPGAVEGLRIVASALFGAVSGIEGEITASARREQGADRSLERAIENLTGAIATLETERDGLDEEATQADIDGYTADIAALGAIVTQLQAERAALPDTAGLTAAEAFQAEIDALAAVSDRLAGGDEDSAVSNRVGDLVASGVTNLLAESIAQLDRDVSDLDDAALLAEREGTLLGRSATAAALDSLVAPLNDRVAAYADGSQAAAQAELEAQIAALAADIASLQSQADALDPEDDAAARALLQSQRDTAVARKNSATTERNTLTGQKPQIEAEIGSLNSQLNTLNQAVAQKDAQIATKSGELTTLLQQSPEAVASAAEMAQAERAAKLATLFTALDESALEGLVEELGKNRRTANQPVNWTQTSEERVSLRQDGDIPLVLPINAHAQLPDTLLREAEELLGLEAGQLSGDAGRQAIALALPVVAVSEAVSLLAAGVPDQPEPRRQKLAL